MRGGGRGATKRYVGLTGGKLQFTGMEVVRRDWTALAHEVQRELYRRLFAGEPVEEYLRAIIGEVTAGRRDGQLVYHKALRKEADDYRAQAPHVVAARKQAAAQPGEPSSWRSVIDYVITVEGPEGRPPSGSTGSIMNTTSSVRSARWQSRCSPLPAATSARCAATNASSSCSERNRVQARLRQGTLYRSSRNSI